VERLIRTAKKHAQLKFKSDPQQKTIIKDEVRNS